MPLTDPNNPAGTEQNGTVWHGFDGLVKQGETRTSIEENAETNTVNYVGPYKVCLAQKPRIGAKFPPFKGTVFSADVEQFRGGKGRLTVTVRDEKEEGTYEIRSVNNDLQLEALPLFNGDDPKGKCGGKKMSDTLGIFWDNKTSLGTQGQEVIARYFNDKNKNPTFATLISLCKQDPELKSVILGDAFQQLHSSAKLIKVFFEKWDRGQETFPVASPVCRRTRSFTTVPKLGKCNTIQTPTGFKNLPTQANGKAWVWIRQPEEITYTGFKNQGQHVEEWIGVNEADEDIYPKG